MILFLVKKVFNLTVKLRKLPYKLNYKFTNFVQYLEWQSGHRYEEGKPKRAKFKSIMYASAKNWMLETHFNRKKVKKDTRTNQMIKSGILNIRGGILRHYIIAGLDRLLFYLVGQLSISTFCELVDTNEIITNKVEIAKR